MTTKSRDRRDRIENVSRRDFLKAFGIGAGALTLGVSVPGTEPLWAQETGSDFPGFSPNLFLTLDADGELTIVAHRSEMGQGSRTGLPTVVADEMEADWNRVRVVQATGHPKYGNQNTDGSRSVRNFFQPMREAGVTARHMLVAAAATAWGVPVAECRAKHHQIVHEPSGRTKSYGELAAKAAEQPVPKPDELTFKPRSEWRYIGKSLPIVDLDEMVTGTAVFGADVRRPGMLFASIERCPVVGGTVESHDASKTLQVPGVKKVYVVEGPGGLGAGFSPLAGVAVLAENTWAALQGRRALEITWNRGAHASYDSDAYRESLAKTAHEPGRVIRDQGDWQTAWDEAETKIEADYYVPHLAQAPMEPPVATAEVKEDGTCEVWAATQAPQTARAQVAEALGLEPEQVTVNVTLLGGGFGRKSKPDFIVEAALLSKQAGAPVQVVWTREDDLQHGYFHAVSHQHLKGALDAQGKPSVWLHRTVFPSISATFNAEADQASNGELRLGFTELPYQVPHLRLENGPAEAHVRIGWMRSVCNIFHAFAHGCFADELAHAAGADPKDFLLELIGPPRKIDLQLPEGVEYDNYGESLDEYPIDTGRLRTVIERAAEAAGWGRKLPKGRGMGIAAHRSFVTYAAVVADVEVGEKGKMHVNEVTIAADCGTYVNRDRVIAQMEGSVIYGMSIAMHGVLTAKDGAIQQGNFDGYPVVRMHEAPKDIRVVLVDNTHPPAGVGEPGTPPVAPAVVNALFAATGERVRELPLAKHGWV